MDDDSKKFEWRAFLFLVVVLAPAVSGLGIAAWGLVVWISQMILGPPGV